MLATELTSLQLTVTAASLFLSVTLTSFTSSCIRVVFVVVRFIAVFNVILFAKAIFFFTNKVNDTAPFETKYPPSHVH